MKKIIDDLNIGDFAYQNGDFGKVAELNGIAYYAEIDSDDIPEDAIVHDVCDMCDQDAVN